MRRLGWLLRVAFHDWMWEGGDKPDLARRLARKLPWYFSDPYADDLRAFAATSHEWARASLPVSIFTQPPTTTGTCCSTVTYTYDTE